MNILMVCLGNICRSPIAEGIMRSKLPANFFVDSAGTISMHEGEHPDKRAVEAAKKFGTDISQQVSRPVTQQDFVKFDKIFCMDSSVYEDVLSFAKNEEDRKKVSLLLVEAGENGENTDVKDPYWGTAEDFERVYLQIDKACDSIAGKILKGN